MGAHTSKNQDPPEYLRQLALEIINKIPATAMQIYTDGSKDEQNSCSSGIFIKAPNCSHNIKIRNSDFCSVFRSELIAIDEALRIIKTMTSPDEIWILCDSRSAIQHLSDWTNVGDKTSVSILKNLKELSQQHEIYFQWIPSHIGLFGNDTADLLAKEGVTENLMSRRTLTFSEIFSKTKSLIQELWKTPPTHPWYNRQAPGGALSIKADRVVQTTISRLASGHIRGLSFNLGQKIYENCTKCNLVQATPDHLLFCAGLEREDIYSSPLLVYDFLRTLGLMDLSSFQAACKALGLLEDDAHWNSTLEEASISESPNKIRELFDIILVFCQVGDPMKLWEKHRDSSSEDVKKQIVAEQGNIDLYLDIVYNQCLILLEDIVISMSGEALLQFGFLSPSREARFAISNHRYVKELAYDTVHLSKIVAENVPKLNQEQKEIYDKILNSITSNSGQCYFLDSSGGTRKTFLIYLLLAKIRRERKIAIAVASSGKAATLIDGGKTALSAFKLPLNLHHS
ncbi:RNase H domain-containing protein [Trichonephila clavipes]|nr:RNase H domain-containing protein [Trichonephila clavipes]